MKPEQVVLDLEATSGRKDKIAIVSRALAEGCEEFFHGVRLTYDALTTFGVKQVPERSGVNGRGLSWEEFRNLAFQLSQRELTGHAARDAIKAAMDRATNNEWNHWYRRILIKDLRCGMSEKTVNDVLADAGRGDLRVPVFTCQLAHDGTDHPKRMTGEKFIEVKLDGVRVLSIVYPNGRVDQYSRSGKELVNFEHIKRQLAAVAGQFVEPMVLDGEVMSNSFQDLMKQIHRKTDVAAGDAILYLFDIVTLREFTANACTQVQSNRSEQLMSWHSLVSSAVPNVRVVEQELVDLSSNEGQRRFREINASAIAGGYEGIMLKDPGALYELKRSHAWLKVKPVITVDLEVKALEEGTGKNEGRLGALVCEGTDNGRTIRVNVGSGFSDEQRDQFWLDANSVTGELVEVMADAVTQNQDGSYSLRFPRFVRFRNFRGEKA